MATPHRPVSPELQVPERYRYVQTYLELHDPDLRLRRSAEARAFYVLERRCRRAPAVNAGMLDNSDLHVQARDGYIHVSTVHPAWLEKPWNIIAALFEEGFDVWAAGGHEAVVNELEYEEKWLAESRVRRRVGIYRNIATDAYGPLSALGNRDGTERSQVSMNGVRPQHRRLKPGKTAARSISFFLNGGK